MPCVSVCMFHISASPPIWRRVDCHVGTNVTKDHAAAIFRVFWKVGWEAYELTFHGLIEDGGSKSLRNVGMYISLYTAAIYRCENVDSDMCVCLISENTWFLWNLWFGGLNSYFMSTVVLDLTPFCLAVRAVTSRPSFHLVVCLTTGPRPLPKRALHIVRSRASFFKWEYPLLSLIKVIQ